MIDPRSVPAGTAAWIVGYLAPDDPDKYSTVGWTTCGCEGTDGIQLDGFHTGTGWRPGVVCDPFAGSGTTLAVATGHGRAALGIDLDRRNVDLGRERLGLALVDVLELPPAEDEASA